MRIEAYDLGKRFGNIWALRNVTLNFEGNVVAILGPNGSGKTTFLTILAGIRYPTEGYVKVNGFEPYRDRFKAVRYISFMFEKPRLPLNVKVKDLIELILEEREDDGEGRELAEKLNIHEFYNEKLYALSSGQAQILGLWVSLACHKGLVIIDEPFAHLDFQRAKALVDIIERRGEIIFSTHVPEEAEALADYVIILRNGKVQWAGLRSELFSRNAYRIYPLVKKHKVIETLRQMGYGNIIDLGLEILVYGCSEEDLTKLISKKIISGFRMGGIKYAYVLGKED
ncbi:MAG: hypothetical protein DRJ66_01210 [Thermoprotei archaeon]|nr:MAG: hypothetical protein DRJ66_01210 [Thermoprotei archaeon]RLF20317.1 MAG: hypothetical protein DRZ82_02605 [Thermoprotei archaeon]